MREGKELRLVVYPKGVMVASCGHSNGLAYDGGSVAEMTRKKS